MLKRKKRSEIRKKEKVNIGSGKKKGSNVVPEVLKQRLHPKLQKLRDMSEELNNIVDT